MALLTTLNAIETNLETILATTLGYSLEDLSDDDIDKTPLAQLRSGDMEILDDEPVSIEEADRIYEVTVKQGLAVSGPNTARATANDIIAALRGAITEAALNTGDIAISKKVNSVTGYRFPEYSHNGKVLIQICQFNINFDAD